MADRSDIMTTKADKGEAVVITDVEDYVKEAEHQLNIKDPYKKLQHDPRQKHIQYWSMTQLHVSKMINELQKTFKKDVKYKNRKRQNFAPHRKYIKQETLDAK